MIDSKELTSVLEPTVRLLGLEIVEAALEQRGRRLVLRIVITAERGVSFEDCVRVTRGVGSLLEEREVIPGSYTLEVTSPGIDRVLKSPREFDLFRGRKVRIRLADDPEVEIEARCAGMRDEDRVAYVAEGEVETVKSWNELARARLEPDWSDSSKQTR